MKHVKSDQKLISVNINFNEGIFSLCLHNRMNLIILRKISQQESLEYGTLDMKIHLNYKLFS